MTLRSGLSRGGSGLQAVRPGSKRQAAPSPHQANHQEHGTRSRAKFKGLPSQPATEFPWGRGLLLHGAPCWPPQLS